MICALFELGLEEKTEENYNKGIEDYLPNSQYEREEHQTMVVQDIIDNWVTLSHNGKFHALFATSSITEAIQYYRLLKEAAPELKITALFDPNIDNNGNDDDYDDNYLVNSYGKDDKYQLNLIDLRVEEEYIYARYNLYSKNKYQKEYSFSNGYTMIIPYSSITSMCISPIQK